MLYQLIQYEFPSTLSEINSVVQLITVAVYFLHSGFKLGTFLYCTNQGDNVTALSIYSILSADSEVEG